MISCKACGKPKKNHSKKLWELHLEMYRIYRKVRRNLMKAQKAKDAINHQDRLDYLKIHISDPGYLK